MEPTGGHRSGLLERDDVHVAYDTHGDGNPAVLLAPAWAISHSGIWARQIDHLARRHRVASYDPRGNGRSDRPTDPAAHDPLTLLGDAVAVLDEAGLERAVVVGNSFGTLLAFLLAGLYPDRVLGAVFLDPSSVNLDGRADDPFQQALATFKDDVGPDEGWGRFNGRSWERDYAGFVRWFVGQAIPEPDAGELRDLGVAWGSSVTMEQLRATIIGRIGVPVAETAARLRGLAERISCPALVVHGELDRICPLHRSEALAEALGAPLVVIDGAGHCPQLTAPGRVNTLLDEFLAGVA